MACCPGLLQKKAASERRGWHWMPKTYYEYVANLIERTTKRNETRDSLCPSTRLLAIMKRVHLTHQQKTGLHAEVTRPRVRLLPCSQLAIAAWAKDRFQLPSAPNQSTASRVLQQGNKSPLSRPGFAPAIQKQHRKGKYLVIEQALHYWVNGQYDARHCVSGSTIQQFGVRLLHKANVNVPDDKRMDMNFSNGWLHRLQSRWGLRSLKMHGEIWDVDESLLQAALLSFKNRLQGYHLRDIFNVDDSGFYYRLAPDKTVARQQLKGRKKRRPGSPLCRARMQTDPKSWT